MTDPNRQPGQVPSGRIPDSILTATALAIEAAAAEFGDDGEVYGQPRVFARAALEAAAPALAAEIAERILEHARAQRPPSEPGTPGADWHRHFGIAARVAAGGPFSALSRSGSHATRRLRQSRPIRGRAGHDGRDRLRRHVVT